MKVLKTKHEGKLLDNPVEIEISENSWKNNPGNIKVRMGLIRPDEIKKDNLATAPADTEPPRKPIPEPTTFDGLEDIQVMNVNMAKSYLNQVPAELLDSFLKQEQEGKNRVSITNHIKELSNEA